MRGRMVPDHCAAEVPQGSDHSSPASFQSYLVDWVRIAVLAKAWLGPESNRRHVDFQSTALPTELPSLCKIFLAALANERAATKAEIVQRSTHNSKPARQLHGTPQHAQIMVA